MTKTKKLQKVAQTIIQIYEQHYLPFNKTKHELMCNLKTELEKIDALKKSINTDIKNNTEDKNSESSQK